MHVLIIYSFNKNLEYILKKELVIDIKTCSTSVSLQTAIVMLKTMLMLIKKLL